MPANAVSTEIPQDFEAEQAVLGAIIYDNDTINQVAALLTPASFYAPAHQYIYRAMLELLDSQHPIDELLLGDQLKTLNQLEEIGGYTYLASLVDCVPSSGNIVYYAKIIQEYALLRQLISTTTDIAKKSRDPEKNVAELLAEAEGKIAEIATRTSDRNYRHIKDLLTLSFERLEKINENANEVTGIPTGFTDLDRLTSGLQDSDLIIVAARPSMGKTAFALNVARYVTTRSENLGAVLIFSLEMSQEQLALRLLTTEAKIDSGRARSGTLEKTDWESLSFATSALSSAQIYICDKSNLNPFELTAICKQLNKEHAHGVSLVIVDYLQLMKSARQNVPREQEISEISRMLKSLAKELNVPVMALSQLNRALESRENKRPRMADLRESGAIEQDADLIFFIYRDEVYDSKTTEPGIAEINVGKHRNGPTGMVKLAFVGKHTKFANYSPRDPGGYLSDDGRGDREKLLSTPPKQLEQ